VAVVVVVRINTVGLRVVIGVQETLVGEAIAVVIDAVAELDSVRLDGGVERGAIGGVGIAIVVVIGIACIAITITIGVRLNAIHLQVDHERAVVRLIKFAVAVVVGVAHVAKPVIVGVQLGAAYRGISEQWAVVRNIRYAIVIIIKVDAISGARAVRVLKALIDKVITVVVDPVAHLRFRVRHGSVERRTICAVGVSITIIIGVARVTIAIRIAINLLTQDRRVWGQRTVVSVIEYAVPVVIGVHAIG
jgi:hypothetical protein